MGYTSWEDGDKASSSFLVIWVSNCHAPGAIVCKVKYKYMHLHCTDHSESYAVRDPCHPYSPDLTHNLSLPPPGSQLLYVKNVSYTTSSLLTQKKTVSFHFIPAHSNHFQLSCFHTPMESQITAHRPSPHYLTPNFTGAREVGCDLPSRPL